MLYLAAGHGLGPAGLALLAPDPLVYSVNLEKAAEVAVLISLFAAGLKIAAIGMVGLGLSLGAVLHGAILAPTDPVLASDVQLREANDATVCASA